MKQEERLKFYRIALNNKVEFYKFNWFSFWFIIISVTSIGFIVSWFVMNWMLRLQILGVSFITSLMFGLVIVWDTKTKYKVVSIKKVNK